MTSPEPPGSEDAPWRQRLHEVIFEADTPAGKAFDVALLVAILASVLLVMVESVESIHAEYGVLLAYGEWTITILFTVEYGLRLLCVRRPLAYARSFFGIIDLLSIVPTYLSLALTGAQSLLVIRAFRLLRMFRILKLGHLVSEATALRSAVVESRGKIVVFLSTVLVVEVIMGTAMYLVESPHNEGFTSIPQSMYWAVVTMTTVGYGDVAPETPLGKLLAAVIMMLGYSLIIVPTGILSAELAQGRRVVSTQACPSCSLEGHDADARHCKYCGARL